MLWPTYALRLTDCFRHIHSSVGEPNACTWVKLVGGEVQPAVHTHSECL